jgi:hypothetical protein
VEVAEPVRILAMLASSISSARSLSAASTVSNGVDVPDGASCAI